MKGDAVDFRHMILDGADSHAAYAADAQPGETVREYRERKQMEHGEQENSGGGPRKHSQAERDHILQEVKKALESDAKVRNGFPNLPFDQPIPLRWRIRSLLLRLRRGIRF